MTKPTVRAPAEWEPHSRCLMSWPCRMDLWGEKLKTVQAEYAAVAKAIAQFEPVLMVANTGSGADARQQCGENVEVVEFPIDDSWMRDNGPIFVLEDHKIVGRNFRFNSWGEKFAPWDKDDALPPLLCDHLNVGCRPVDMVLEGGGIVTDGQGTLITTESCLLNPNRNPTMSRSEIEATLKESLGIRKVIWLPGGLDWGTDGHVDGVVAYLAPAKVLFEWAPPDTEEGRSLRENRKALEAATDAEGRNFEIFEMPPINAPEIPYFAPGGSDEHGPFFYINFYLANGGVVVSVAGVPAEDEKVLTCLRKLFPERRVVGVPVRTVEWGGGAIHCITQQVPKAVPQ